MQESSSSSSWINQSTAARELQLASRILSHRRLKIAAKWCAEQSLGIVQAAAAASSPSTEHVHLNEHNNNNNNNTALEELEELWNYESNNTFPAADTTTTSSSTDDASYLYAQTLLDLGEYAHAAAVLSESPSSSSPDTTTTMEEGRMPEPLSFLRPCGIFLRAYSMYMAGERRKEEKLAEEEG